MPPPRPRILNGLAQADQSQGLEERVALAIRRRRPQRTVLQIDHDDILVVEVDGCGHVGQKTTFPLSAAGARYHDHGVVGPNGAAVVPRDIPNKDALAVDDRLGDRAGVSLERPKEDGGESQDKGEGRRQGEILSGK